MLFTLRSSVAVLGTISLSVKTIDILFQSAVFAPRAPTLTGAVDDYLTDSSLAVHKPKSLIFKRSV